MKIGIAAATSFEIQPTIDWLRHREYRLGLNEAEVVITGIGTLQAAYALGRFIQAQKPALMLQAGVGGSFSAQLPPPTVVWLRDDLMADLGVEETAQFRDIFDMGLQEPDAFPFQNGRLKNTGTAITGRLHAAAASGITVNEITTRPDRIEMIRSKYHCEIESMEGAAFHYVCLQEGVPFIQLRAVSNLIGERDKSKWMMKAAIEALNKELAHLLKTL